MLREKLQKITLDFISSRCEEVYIPAGVVTTSIRLINVMMNKMLVSEKITPSMVKLSKEVGFGVRYVQYGVNILRDAGILDTDRIRKNGKRYENIYSLNEDFSNLSDDGVELLDPIEYLKDYYSPFSANNEPTDLKPKLDSLAVKKPANPIEPSFCNSSNNTNLKLNIISIKILEEEDFVGILSKFNKISRPPRINLRKIEKEKRRKIICFKNTFLGLWRFYFKDGKYYFSTIAFEIAFENFHNHFGGCWVALAKYFERVSKGNLNVTHYLSCKEKKAKFKKWELQIGFIMKLEVIEQVEAGDWDPDDVCRKRVLKKDQVEKVEKDDEIPSEEKEVRKNIINVVGFDYYKKWLEKAKILINKTTSKVVEIILKLPNKFMLDYAQRPSREYERLSQCGFKLAV
jgi:hypothetical protein